MKLRAYLVDDEPLALERLRRLLSSAVVGKVGGTLVPAAAKRRVPMAIMKKPPAASMAPAT